MNPTHPHGAEALAVNESLIVLHPGWPLPCQLPVLAKRLSLSTHAGVLASSPSSCSTLSRLKLPGTLLWGQKSVSASFIVDSFISQDLATQARIPVETLPEPKTILGLDGEVLTRITQQTQTIPLIVSRTHRAKFHLFLIPASSSPGVLGAPWLARHNPQIDWLT